MEDIPNTAVCLQCGYSLRGLSVPRCPECGRLFDPKDPRSFRDASTPSVWRRSVWELWAAAPPSWHVVSAVIFTVAAMASASVWIEPLFGASHDLGLLFTMCFVPLGALALAGDYMLRLVSVSIKKQARRDVDTPQPSRGLWRWLVLPVCFAVFVSLFIHPWPLHVRFALSRAAFEQAARKYLDGSDARTGPRRIGLYWVREIDSEDPGTVGFRAGTSMCDPIGFVYDPQEPPLRRYWYQVAPEWYMDEW